MLGTLAKKTGGAKKRSNRGRVPGPGGAFQRWSKSNPKRKKKSGSGVVARATASKRGTKLTRTKGGIVASAANAAKKAAKGKAGVSAVAKGVGGKRGTKPKKTMRRGTLGSVAAKSVKRKTGVAAKKASMRRKAKSVQNPRKAKKAAVRYSRY